MLMDILAVGVFGVVKVVVFVCDAVTFLPYFLFTTRTRAIVTKRLKAQSMTDDPRGPYRCVDHAHSLATSLVPGCETVYELLDRAVESFPDKACLGSRICLMEMDEKQENGRVFKKAVYGDYEWQTFSEVRERARNLGSGLVSLGHEPREVFVLFAESCADWMVAAAAAFSYNFPVSTLYATLGDDSLVYMVNETNAKRIVTTADLLPKFLSLIPRLPSVTHIIYMDRYRKPPMVDFPPSITVMSMTALETIGQKQANEPTIKTTGSDLAVIMYTSGSTSFPKGVMLSHHNMICGMSGLCERIIDLGPDDLYIAYLPLAHVLELAAELSCLSYGIPIGYSSAQTITDQSTRIKAGCKGDISVLRPTVMTSVPLVLDRIYKAVWDKVNHGNPFARQFFRFAYKYKEFWSMYGYNTPLLDKLVFSKISRLLGGHVRHMVSGSAPLNHATQRFVNTCFCMTMVQGYGLTETFGAGCVGQAYDNNTQHVGHPLICCEILLKDWEEGGYKGTDSPKPRGEVCIGGGNVAIGYYKQPEKTAEDFVKIGGTRYFCTGDIGEIQPDGTLRIIDRRKDLVKLQAGEYVSLGKVETALKLCPVVEQICVYADSAYDFAVCFVIPNAKQLRAFAKSVGVENGSLSDLCERKDMEAYVLGQLQMVAKKAKLARFETPTKVKLSPDLWTPESGLLTEAFKMKRQNLARHYAASISHMYP